MFEELKKKALKSSLVLSVIFLIAGGVMVGLMATNMFYIVFGYKNFEDLKPEEIKNQLVEYEMKYNYGGFLEEYEYNETTHQSKTTALYYIIWTGDDDVENFCYMTVKVPPSYESKMEEMAENSYVYLASEPINIKGKIAKLGEEEYEYFVDFFEEAGWTESEIEEYISTSEPYDKAGSYAIQGKASLLVKGINGDYFNVVGLPVARLKRELANFIK